MFKRCKRRERDELILCLLDVRWINIEEGGLSLDVSNEVENKLDEIVVGAQEDLEGGRVK